MKTLYCNRQGCVSTLQALLSWCWQRPWIHYQNGGSTDLLPHLHARHKPHATVVPGATINMLRNIKIASWELRLWNHLPQPLQIGRVHARHSTMLGARCLTPLCSVLVELSYPNTLRLGHFDANATAAVAALVQLMGVTAPALHAEMAGDVILWPLEVRNVGGVEVFVMVPSMSVNVSGNTPWPQEGHHSTCMSCLRGVGEQQSCTCSGNSNSGDIYQPRC